MSSKKNKNNSSSKKSKKSTVNNSPKKRYNRRWNASCKTTKSNINVSKINKFPDENKQEKNKENSPKRLIKESTKAAFKVLKRRPRNERSQT